MNRRGRHALRTLALCTGVLLGCSDDDDDAQRDAGSVEDAAVDARLAIPEFNGCSAEDYVDLSAEDAARVVTIAGAGLTYTPKCLIVAAGQSVRFEGSLAAHPLAPGHPDDPSAGTSENPIEETSSGREASFTFERAGTYPYHCTLHSFGAGQGMAGTIHVR